MLAQRPREFSFSRPAWVRINCLRTIVDLFRFETHKWGMASMAACECGAKKQIIEDVITSCHIYHYSNGARACRQELGDLVDENMSGHLVDHPAAVHLLKTKKKIKAFIFKINKRYLKAYLL